MRPSALVAGQTYTQVAAGGLHTVLLTSDGTAVACGGSGSGQCNVPELVAGQIYTHVAAGQFHAALLKSDGTVVACGSNDDGQCDIPALVAGQTYTGHVLQALLLQASFDSESIRFVTFGRLERYRLSARPTSRLADIYDQLMNEYCAGTLSPGVARVEAVLPEGRLFSSASAEETVESVFGTAPPGCTASK